MKIMLYKNHLPFKLDVQILTQAPTNETNPENKKNIAGYVN